MRFTTTYDHTNLIARDWRTLAGGSPHGEIVSTQAGTRTVTWAYVRAPEGNLVELQSWSC